MAKPFGLPLDVMLSILRDVRRLTVEVLDRADEHGREAALAWLDERAATRVDALYSSIEEDAGIEAQAESWSVISRHILDARQSVLPPRRRRRKAA